MTEWLTMEEAAARVHKVQPWRRAMFGDNPPSAQMRHKAARVAIKGAALEEVEAATRKVRAAEAEQRTAMEHAASVRCSLRAIAAAAEMSASRVRMRLKTQASQ